MERIATHVWEYVRNNRLGIVTVTLSLTFMFVGLPSQILRILETKSAKEISITMFSLLVVQSFFWVLYGYQKRDWFVVTANAFGTFFSLVIVIEWFLFQ